MYYDAYIFKVEICKRNGRQNNHHGNIYRKCIGKTRQGCGKVFDGKISGQR